LPVFVLVRRQRLEEVAIEVMNQVTGYVFLSEETPDFIARNLVSHLRHYAASLKTPFFGRLVDYGEEGNQLWTCPGHNGGAFYARSPISRTFVAHLGEAIFRDDLDNSILELADLLTHEGPALEAQKAGAQIFGAEKTYFVLNGTSASNKVVLSALIAKDDLVLFDRNNHKAAHHGAFFMGGAIPIFLPSQRNCHGLIGPIDYDALDEVSIRTAIRDDPLVTDPETWQRKRPFRAAVIEQCTYDGTIYDVGMLLRQIGHLCDYVLFDEAWAGFLKFHPLFAGRFAMSLTDLDENQPGIIATQSTHKQLASFSQASQIHVKDRHIKHRRVGHRRFNEMFLLHASTSAFYPLFASIDVGAQMMKGKSGEVLWDDTIRLGIELRKKLRAVAREYNQKQSDPADNWFFDPFVPDHVTVDGTDGFAVQMRWEDVPTDRLAIDPAMWELTPGATWHGFDHLVPGYAITDPNKLTLLTPGFDRASGTYAAHVVPAPIVAEFLRDNWMVCEKNDLNSILFLLTPGVEASKAGTLLSALVRFKALHEANAPLTEVLTEFTARHAARYGDMRLRDLCSEMHAFFRDHDTSGLQRKQFRLEHLPEVVLPPYEAVQRMIRNEVELLPIDGIAGRIAANLMLVYPPGIATVVPGERLGGRAQPMLDYLAVFERAANQFPGFESEVQRVYRRIKPDDSVRLYTFVLNE
jgi:ornithine decarboxylase